MHLYILLLFSILTFSGCTSNKESSNNTVSNHQPVPDLKNRTQELVYDLNESTSIIISFLKNGNLSEILAEEARNAPETIDILIKNFSPAEMAFEAEVLNFKGPAIILFYDEKSPQAQIIDSSFKELAFKYHNKAKFVKVEVSKLFKLAEQAVVTDAPTLLLIHNRAEVDRVEKAEPSLFDADFLSLLEKIK
jgi:hypothetical protein